MFCSKKFKSTLPKSLLGDKEILIDEKNDKKARHEGALSVLFYQEIKRM